jgi:hypothetical protein
MQEPTIYRAPLAFGEDEKDEPATTYSSHPSYTGYGQNVNSTTVIESLAGKDYHDFVIPEGEHLPLQPKATLGRLAILLTSVVCKTGSWASSRLLSSSSTE